MADISAAYKPPNGSQVLASSPSNLVAQHTAHYTTRDIAKAASLSFDLYGLHICDRTALITCCLS